MITPKMILAALLFSGVLCAAEPAQTMAQIEEQKQLADSSVIVGVPDDFKTPLKAFELYFNGLGANDSSRFLSLTPHAIKEWLEVDSLTPEMLVRLNEHRATLDLKDFVILEFRFTPDENRPQIVLGFRYNYQDDRQRVITVERQKLTFLRTAEGWKIDQTANEPVQ